MDFEADGNDTRTRAEEFHEEALRSIRQFEEQRQRRVNSEVLTYLLQRAQTYAALATMEYERLSANQYADAERNAGGYEVTSVLPIASQVRSVAEHLRRNKEND
jgi:hypothetical protein